MRIKIDFDKNDLASGFYRTNKLTINTSIISCLNLLDDVSCIGVTLRIPTSQYLDTNPIKALNFILEEKTEIGIILTLKSVEK